MKNNAFLKAGRRWFFRIVVAAGCATLFALSATPVQAQQRTVLSGHVPGPVTKLQLRPLRQLAATNRLHLAIG
ncbi:MAG TPA: hypothetical protein VKA67_03980, partial [Verrucomicrobiae bacterium]|nr:hypothetical protein [Verrucomicrobiae bacterium]